MSGQGKQKVSFTGSVEAKVCAEQRTMRCRCNVSLCHEMVMPPPRPQRYGIVSFTPANTETCRGVLTKPPTKHAWVIIVKVSFSIAFETDKASLAGSSNYSRSQPHAPRRASVDVDATTHRPWGSVASAGFWQVRNDRNANDNRQKSSQCASAIISQKEQPEKIVTSRQRVKQPAEHKAGFVDDE